MWLSENCYCDWNKRYNPFREERNGHFNSKFNFKLFKLSTPRCREFSLIFSHCFCEVEQPGKWEFVSYLFSSKMEQKFLFHTLCVWFDNGKGIRYMRSTRSFPKKIIPNCLLNDKDFNFIQFLSTWMLFHSL